MTDLDVQRDAAGVPVARVTGEIDASRAAELEAKLLAIVANDDLGLVVDLAGTTYIDSAGVRLLFNLAERLSTRGQRLRVAVPPDTSIRRVLSITRFDTLVALDDSPEASAAALAS